MRNYEKEKRETRSKILHAFWEIYRTTRIEKITVKQITEACGIYRTTFYLHYSDVYAILENLEKDLLDELIEFKSHLLVENEGTKEVLFKLYNICNAKREYLEMLVLKQNSNFSMRYKQEMVSVLCRVYGIPNAYMTNFLHQTIMEALAEAMLRWVGQENLEFEEMYQALEHYLKKGILAALLER